MTHYLALLQYGKSSKQKVPERSLKLPKRVTVVYLEDKMYSIPRRKARDKLIERGRVKEVLIASDEDVHAVHRKIDAAFSMHVEYEFLYASSGSDLLRAELPQGLSSWSGEAVLQLLGDGNSLYIKSSNASLQESVSAPQGPQPLPFQPQPVTTAAHCHQQNVLSSHLWPPPIKKPAAHIHPQPITLQGLHTFNLVHNKWPDHGCLLW